MKYVAVRNDHIKPGTDAYPFLDFDCGYEECEKLAKFGPKAYGHCPLTADYLRDYPHCWSIIRWPELEEP